MIKESRIKRNPETAQESEIYTSKLETLLSSIEDGTIFDGISPEIWAIAEEIVKNNPEITKHI